MTTRKQVQIAQIVGSYLFNPTGLSLMLLMLLITAAFWPASALALSIGAGAAMILGLIVAPLGALIYLSTLAVEIYKDCKHQHIGFGRYLSDSLKKWLAWTERHNTQSSLRGGILLVGFCVSIGFLVMPFVPKDADFVGGLGESLLKALTHLSGLPGLEFLAPLANMAVTHVITLILFVFSPLIFSYALQKIIGSCIPEDIQDRHERIGYEKTVKWKEEKQSPWCCFEVFENTTIGQVFSNPKKDSDNNFPVIDEDNTKNDDPGKHVNMTQGNT